MKKRFLAMVLSASMVTLMLTGCGSSSKDASSTTTAAGSAATTAAASGEKENVSLTLWGAEEDQDLLNEMVESFKTQYADKATFDIQIGVQSESTAKDTVLTDIEAAADVFAFADDQINSLVAAGALQPVQDTDLITTSNIASSVDAATVNGTLYAYPMTADNGYFMFYDAEYFTDDDVKTMDGMLAAAEKAGKKITMDFSSGWYTASFFLGAGLNLGLADDGLTNICNWNATDTTVKGVDVGNAMLAIAQNSSFVSLTDAEFVTGIQDGSIIAGVNGVWNATAAQTAWGDNYRAAKLPTYTCGGSQVQMGSFAGFKLLGVNAYSKNVGWAMLLAEWITNEANQTLRFNERAQGPSNINAAASSDVQASPAIAALAAQADYAVAQRVGGNFWDPATTFGTIISSGNPDGTDMQTLLDNLVSGITAAAQ